MNTRHEKLIRFYIEQVLERYDGQSDRGRGRGRGTGRGPNRGRGSGQQNVRAAAPRPQPNLLEPNGWIW